MFVVRAPETAARILSAVHPFHAEPASPRMDPIFKGDLERAIEETHAQIDPAEFQAAWTYGQKLSMAEACALALTGLDEL